MDNSPKAQLTARPWLQLGLRLAVFCLPLVLGLGALEWWAERVPNIYSLKRQQLMAVTNKVDTLIIGSSSAYYGIKPELLSGHAYNLAGPQETLYEGDRVLTTILPMLPNLKRVLLHVQYPTFFFRMAAAPENWRQYSYQQEWGVRPMQESACFDCAMLSRVALRTPRYYLDLLAKATWGWVRSGHFVLNQPEIRDTDACGWYPAVRVKTPPPDLFGKVQALHELSIRHGMMNPEWEAGNIACLDHILYLLRERNIEADFVTLPIWSSYLKVQSDDCWKETQRVVAQRTNGTTVRNFCYLIMPQFQTNAFYDVDHLSPLGAKEFTKILNSDLNRQPQGQNAMTTLENKTITQ